MSTDYDQQAKRWKRDKPQRLSDFVARPKVMEIFKEYTLGNVVLDAGCEEGYLHSKIATISKKVIGI